MLLPLLAAAAVPTEAPVFAQPSGKWVVEHTDTACVLSRSYGVGEHALTLVLRPYPLSTGVEVTLITSRASSRAGDAKLQLLPAGQPAHGTYRRVATPDRQQSTVRMWFENDPLARFASADGMAIAVADNRYLLAVPGAASGIRALVACQKDLLTAWKVDPGELADDFTRPKPIVDPGAYFSRDSYPLTALQAHAEGRVIALLTVTADGKPDRCSVVERVHPALDYQTCAIAMKRMRFSPGLDAAGRPREAHFALPVTWLIDSRY